MHPAFPRSDVLSRSQPRSTGTVRGDGMDKTHKEGMEGMEGMGWKGDTTGDLESLDIRWVLVGVKSNFYGFYILYSFSWNVLDQLILGILNMFIAICSNYSGFFF